jgi:hypothetical protein
MHRQETTYPHVVPLTGSHGGLRLALAGGA